MNPYEAPTPDLLAYGAALVMFFLTGLALWRSNQADMVNRYMFNALTFGLTGIALVVVGADLTVTWIQFDKDVVQDPHTSAASVILSIGIFVAMAYLTLNATSRGKSVQSAAALVGLNASGAISSYTIFMYDIRVDEWLLATTAFWYMTAMTLCAFLVTVAMHLLRAYGHRQFHKGRASALAQQGHVQGTPYADAVPRTN